MINKRKNKKCQSEFEEDNIITQKSSDNQLESSKTLNETEIDEIIKNIDNVLNNTNSDEIREKIKNGQELIFIDNDNFEVSFTSSDNENINRNKNIITINLNECENKLKEKYNISKNE